MQCLKSLPQTLITCNLFVTFFSKISTLLLAVQLWTQCTINSIVNVFMYKVQPFMSGVCTLMRRRFVTEFYEGSEIVCEHFVGLYKFGRHVSVSWALRKTTTIIIITQFLTYGHDVRLSDINDLIDFLSLIFL